MRLLADIASYVTDRISSEDITLEEYVTTGSLLQNKRGRCKAENLPLVACSLTHFKEGDILVANIRPYLKKVWLADSEGGCSADVLAFRAKDGHSSEYLHALLMQDSFQRDIFLAAQQATPVTDDSEYIYNSLKRNSKFPVSAEKEACVVETVNELLADVPNATTIIIEDIMNNRRGFNRARVERSKLVIVSELIDEFHYCRYLQVTATQRLISKSRRPHTQMR